jgi:hypothetical protein
LQAAVSVSYPNLSTFQCHIPSDPIGFDLTMRVIIFDYDDTLFPTSYISRHELYNTHVNSIEFQHHREAFLELENAAICMLAEAVSVGDLVVIVTNGKLDWIKYSMKMFYHRLFEFVRKSDTPIVSAQDIFAVYSPHPTMWKMYCFKHLLTSLASTNMKPSILISVGDGEHEALACESAARGADIPYRNVIFLETPSPRHMTKQLNILIRELKDVIGHHAVTVDFKATVTSGGNIEFCPMLKNEDEEKSSFVSAVPVHERPPTPVQPAQTVS